MGITTHYLSDLTSDLLNKAVREQALYMFITKTYDNNDELVIETANTSNYKASVFDPLKEMVFGKRIDADNISPVLPRYDWSANTVYQEWSSTSNTVFFESEGGDIDPFFVYTSSGNVYKCIDNNENGESSVEPTHVDTLPRQEADGYSWKYMYTVPSASKFVTSEYIPVVPNTAIVTASDTSIDKIYVENGGNTFVEVSNGSIASFVNTTAFTIQQHTLEYANGSTFIPADNFYNNLSVLLYEPGARSNGSLYTIDDYDSSTRRVRIDNQYGAFTNITQYEITPRVRIVGDGYGATAIPVVNPTTKGISSVEIKSSGTGYTYANTIIEANTGVGAEVVSVIAPPQGHGFDSATELGCDRVMVSISIDGNEANTLPIDFQNGFRGAGIILNPSPANTSYVGTVSVVKGQNLITGLDTKLDDVFSVPSLDTVAGLTVAAVNTDIFASGSNTEIANTIVDLFNEFNRNLVVQTTNPPKIVVIGDDFTDVRTVLDVPSNTTLYTTETAVSTQSDVPFRKLYNGNTFNQTKTLVVDQADAFSNGEVILTTDYTRYGTLINQSANTLTIVGTEFPEGTNIIGEVSGTTANVVNSTISDTAIDPYHGQVLYLNNFLKVSKTESSNVEFNIVIKV